MARKRNKKKKVQRERTRTNVEEWKFIFTMRESRYVEWPKFLRELTSQLLSRSLLLPVPAGEAPPAIQPANLAILVPGVGNSQLKKHLRDGGFTQIHELDFSKFITPDFLCKDSDAANQLRYDWTAAFADETFDAVVDKGGLDLLTLPDVEFTTSGIVYMSKVKEILRPGGKYICITSAEPKLLDLLFRKFRCGWKMSLHAISTQYPRVQTFMVVLEKDICASVSKISFFLDDYSDDLYIRSHGSKKHEKFVEALVKEEEIRSTYSDLCTLKGLNLESLKDFEPGRKIKLILGDPAGPYYYRAVLVDAEQHPTSPLLHQFAVYVVPEAHVNEWSFSSEEGQMHYASKLRAARLLMILMESTHEIPDTGRIQGHLSRLVRPLAPTSGQHSTIFIRRGTHDDDIVESDVELEISDLIEAEKDPPQKMGNPLIEVTDENKKAAQISKAKANEAISDGKFSEAIDYLTEAIMLNPMSAIMYANRASVFIKLKKPSAAIRDGNAALQINPDSAKGHKARGIALAMLGSWEDAVDDLHVASKLDFDEEIDSALKKVETNAKRMKEHRIKYDRLREEKKLREIDQKKKKREDAESASVLKDGEVIRIRSASELEKELNAASKIVRLTILCFTAPSCGPLSVISTLATQYPKAVFLKVDIEEVKEATGEWDITMVPCFSFVKNGKEVDKVVGVDKTSLEKKIAQYS